MLRLARQGHGALKSGFICTTCRVLLVSGTARQPAAVAKLCAPRFYSSAPADQLRSQEKIEVSIDKKADVKPGKVTDSRPDNKPEGNDKETTEKTKNEPGEKSDAEPSKMWKKKKKKSKKKAAAVETKAGETGNKAGETDKSGETVNKVEKSDNKAEETDNKPENTPEAGIEKTEKKAEKTDSKPKKAKKKSKAKKADNTPEEKPEEKPETNVEQKTDSTAAEADSKPEKTGKKPKTKAEAKSVGPRPPASTSRSSRAARQRLESQAPVTPPESPAHKLLLWQETLKIIKEIKADETPSPLEPSNGPSDKNKPPAPVPVSNGKGVESAELTATPSDTEILDGALAVLKKVLRRELQDTAPGSTAEAAASQKRPAAPPKHEKTEKKSAAASPAGPQGSLGGPLGIVSKSAAVKTPAPVQQQVGDGSVGQPGKKSVVKPAPAPAAKKPAGTKKVKRKRAELVVNMVNSTSVKMTPVEKPQPPVPSLAYGLDRVLFNPGVYHIQDPRSRVFNFDPYLAHIMPVKQFDFNALKKYVTSSKDMTLIQTAAELKKKYTGSTSSMTSTLSHFHYLLSAWRPLNFDMLSRNFYVDSSNVTRAMRAPAATFLHWKDGVYAIDADKEFDTASILSLLGKSMEKLLTLPKQDFEKYRITKSDQLTEEERNGPEAFHFTTLGDFLMRSQLDAHDPRLPGSGMFDLKTRAVVSIRMEMHTLKSGQGYEIRNRLGQWESFEREYYDMIRAAFLKYSLQVRMGRMDGIFVAYHNTRRIFGFQYIPLQDMDLALHGQTDLTLGDREFKLSVHLLNEVLDKVTAKYPGRTLRLHFEARTGSMPFMYIFAKPVTPAEVEAIQGSTQAKVEEFERRMLGIVREEQALEEQEKAVEEEEYGEEGVEEADEHDLDEGEGDQAARSAAWEEVMLKVEDEMEDEEHGITFVREAIEDGLQESGLLQTSPPEETQRYVDAFLEALTGETRRATSESPEPSAAAEGATVESSEAETSAETEAPAKQLSDNATGPVATASGSSEVADATENPVDDLHIETQPPAAEELAEGVTEETSDEPTLKDLIVKLATQIRTIPSERRTPSGDEADVVDEDAPEYAQRLRKIERILSELTEQPREGEESGVVETGPVSADVEEPAEPAERAEQGDKDKQAAMATEETKEEDATAPPPEPNPATSHFSTKGFVDEADGGELYGLILTVRNKVDGEYVERPEDLSSHQRWLVEYNIEEIPTERAHKLYQMMLNRRKSLLHVEHEDRRPSSSNDIKEDDAEEDDVDEDFADKNTNSIDKKKSSGSSSGNDNNNNGNDASSTNTSTNTSTSGGSGSASAKSTSSKPTSFKPAGGFKNGGGGGFKPGGSGKGGGGGGGGGGSPKGGWQDEFLARLALYTRRGRQFRQREEQLLRSQPIHVYGADTPYTYQSICETVREDGTRPYESWPGSQAAKAAEGKAEGDKAAAEGEKRDKAAPGSGSEAKSESEPESKSGSDSTSDANSGTKS